jgi:uncharacterized protein YbgA (DUF1722 family)/uncharacterized protein YbbK (DUF523 family)
MNSYVNKTLGEYFEFRGFCPEVAIGLGIPRKPIRLIRTADSDAIRCVSTVDDQQDFTEALDEIADQQRQWQKELCGYILKRGSPSCGMERVKVYNPKGMPENIGAGIYAANLMKNLPYLPVEEEGRLGDSRLRENFVQRVFVLWRWKQLCGNGLSIPAIMEFHARHKLILMSHNQNDYRELGQFVSRLGEEKSQDKQELNKRAEEYIYKVMQTLKKVASISNHVNVLQHIQGYLKKQLDKEDKQELGECIENYRNGIVPLIVPVTLLNHHFRKHPSAYIDNSWYMQPYPAELSLTNQI